MSQSHQALEKSRQLVGDIAESLRSTASDQPLAKDTIPELLHPIAADESAPQSSVSSPNQLSKELCRLYEACSHGLLSIWQPFPRPALFSRAFNKLFNSRRGTKMPRRMDSCEKPGL